MYFKGVSHVWPAQALKPSYGFLSLTHFSRFEGSPEYPQKFGRSVVPSTQINLLRQDVQSNGELPKHVQGVSSSGRYSPIQKWWSTVLEPLINESHSKTHGNIWITNLYGLFVPNKTAEKVDFCLWSDRCQVKAQVFTAMLSISPYFLLLSNKILETIEVCFVALFPK